MRVKHKNCGRVFGEGLLQKESTKIVTGSQYLVEGNQNLVVGSKIILVANHKCGPQILAADIGPFRTIMEELTGPNILV